MTTTFRIANRIFFTVNVGGQQHRTSEDGYFSTEIGVLNRPRNDYDQCGQGQETVLSKGTPACQFFDKWDHIHLKTVRLFSDEQISELLNDIEVLKNEYPHIDSSNFNRIVAFDREMSIK